MSITKFEQETIILFNEAEGAAEVYTHSARLKKRLAELHAQRPEEVKQTGGKGQSVTYTIPKAWVRINPGLRLTDEQREQRAESMKKARITKNLNSQSGHKPAAQHLREVIPTT